MNISTAIAAAEELSVTYTHLPSPARELKGLFNAGLMKITLPGEALDFNNNNTTGLLQLLKAVGRTNLSVGRIYEGHINALHLIHLYASEAQKKRWFADAANGCLFGVWNTQAEDGIHITAGTNGTFALHGKKTFASGAGLVNRALVTGNLSRDGVNGWQMCIVNMDDLPKNNIDFNSWKPLGMHASVSYTVNFEGYNAPLADLFGNVNDYYRQPYFSGGATRFCAVQIGGAEALFNGTVAYLRGLQRTGDPHQNARIAEMATNLAAGNLWLQQGAENWDAWKERSEQHDRLLAFANMMRVATENICLNVIELSSKCIGARGLMQTYNMEKVVRDLQFYLRQPAPDAAMADVARYVFQSGTNIETMWNEAL